MGGQLWLRDGYDYEGIEGQVWKVDGQRCTALIRGASTFSHNLKQVLPKVQDFFLTKLGDGSSFFFWLHEWSGWTPFERSSQDYLHWSRVRDCLDDTWNPFSEENLSDLGVEEFTKTQ